ncbi:MAG TPA: DUF1553 domain-containing protein [Bryobacteraceae bacterium]|nr:DUF1553 domain-containing protein [Bryobacteraceae bacterium]
MISALILTAFGAAAVAGTGKSVAAPFEAASEPARRGKIDELVSANWKRLKIQPANPCSDEVFVRRVYLDLIGTLPTPEEASQFLKDRSPARRSALIDRLLERPEFVDYWGTKWGDLLRIKSEFPINLWPNAVQAYDHWIRTSLRNNLPYDRFARQLLVSNGSNFRVPEVNFYRAVQSRDPQSIAQTVALTFMGTRAGAWPKARLDGMAAFFSRIGYKSTTEWKEEIVYFDVAGSAPGADGTPPIASGAPRVPVALGAAFFPDGKAARFAPGQDPREVFANWLLAPGNPWFARNIVNRVWYWLLGRGIVQEPDDIRPDNPPANPQLLAWLERELVAAHYDLKHIYRLILNSQVYQLSSIPGSTDAKTVANFAYYPLRRLDAETLIDAVCQITGTTEDYSSPIPEPFTYLPENQRSIALPDGSIGSAFLDMFGRPPRDTGLESERNNSPSAEQRLHLLNSSHIQLKIQNSARLRTLVQPQPGGKPRDPIDRIYLAILSRYPTGDELKTVTKYFQSVPGNKWPATVDLAWALINSAEFLYRH